jgi:hypothetical protein
VWQWHKGKGTHFARWVRILACHYQLFEQLPDEKQGGIVAIHCSMMSKSNQPRGLT